ncbi:OmpH family outer membrane protein [Allohahella marinimesophila]|uniref:OmpH family outer membrane protein n=1 Tax=Allohahella marinimesophila TaxID=1054972 RepID=A0ABP7PQ81_9GAMM
MFLKRLVLTCSLLSVAGFATAEMQIGIIDLRAALLGSESAKSFSTQMEKDFADDDARIRKVGEEAQKLQQRLQKDGAIMSESEKEKAQAELEEKVQEFNFLKNKFQNSVAKREELFVNQSKPKVDAAIKKLAADNDLDLVLPKTVAVFSAPALDITDKLIEELNKQ